jgi:hypothetical protein
MYIILTTNPNISFGDCESMIFLLHCTHSVGSVVVGMPELHGFLESVSYSLRRCAGDEVLAAYSIKFDICSDSLDICADSVCSHARASCFGQRTASLRSCCYSHIF